MITISLTSRKIRVVTFSRFFLIARVIIETLTESPKIEETLRPLAKEDKPLKKKELVRNIYISMHEQLVRVRMRNYALGVSSPRFMAG